MSPSKTKFFVFTLVALVALTAASGGLKGKSKLPGTYTCGPDGTALCPPTTAKLAVAPSASLAKIEAKVFKDANILTAKIKSEIKHEHKVKDAETKIDEKYENMANVAAAAAAAAASAENPVLLDVADAPVAPVAPVVVAPVAGLTSGEDMDPEPSLVEWGWGRSFAAKIAAAVSKLVSMGHGWKAYGGEYGGAETVVSGGLCMVSGLVAGNSWGIVATLPANCRPSKRLIFNLNNNQFTSRVDVLTNGQVHWVAGGRSHPWLSLTGITFAPSASKQVAVSMGWGYSAYGYGYGGAEAVVHNGECTVSGLIKLGKGAVMATLPANCRPSKRLIFNLNNHQFTARVDVFTNGEVRWLAGGRSHGWLSLTGIEFATSASKQVAVSMSPGYTAYGYGFGGAEAVVHNGECTVSGLIKFGGGNIMATLPANCRPSKRLIFNLNNNQFTSRVDVLPNGQVHWMAGGRSHGWLSLTGITFAYDKAIAAKIAAAAAAAVAQAKAVAESAAKVAAAVQAAAAKAAAVLAQAVKDAAQDAADEAQAAAEEVERIKKAAAEGLQKLADEAKARAAQGAKNLMTALEQRDGKSMKALLGDVKGAFESAQSKVQAADAMVKEYKEKMNSLFESKLAKAVGMGNDVKYKNAVLNTHLRTPGLSDKGAVDQTYIKLGFKGNQNSVVDDAYLLLGYGDYPCGGAAVGNKDGMGACIEKDYSGTKKKVMTGYMVSVGATIRADKICSGLEKALDLDVCKVVPTMKYAKLGLQINTANVNLEGDGLPSEVELPAAFGEDKDTLNKEVKVFGEFDIPANAQCGLDPVCHVCKGLSTYVGAPKVEAIFQPGGDASFAMVTGEKEKPKWITAGGTPLMAFKELKIDVAKTGTETSASIGLKIDFCIDKCDTPKEDDKQLLNFEGKLTAKNDKGETAVDMSLTMKGHYQIPSTIFSFGNLGALASATIGKKTGIKGFSAEGTLCIGKGCEATNGFWAKGGEMPPVGTPQSEMVSDYGLKEWTVDHDEPNPCIVAKVAIGVAKDEKTPKMSPFFYVQIPKATMGNFMAVIGINPKMIPTPLAQSGIKDFIFSQNYGTSEGKTINPSGKGLTIPSGLHMEGTVTNLLGMVDAKFDLSINKNYMEGIFSLSCFQFGSFLDVTKDRTQKQGAGCVGPFIKGYIGYLGDGVSGALSKDKWCKGQFCIEGSANVKIGFLKLDMEFKIEAYKTATKTVGKLSGKGIPFHILPGAKMDFSAEWDLPLAASKLSQKALEAKPASLKMDVVIDTTGFQKLMMYPVFALVKVVRFAVYTPINIVIAVIAFIKRKILPLASSLLAGILTIINAVDGKLNSAQATLTNGLNSKKNSLRNAGCDIPRSLIEFAESFLEENKWDGHTGIGSPTEMLQMNTKIGCFRDCPVHYPSDKACASVELQCYRDRARIELLEVGGKRGLLAKRSKVKWGFVKKAYDWGAHHARVAAAKARAWAAEKARQVAAAARRAAAYAAEKARQAREWAAEKARQVAAAARAAAAAAARAAAAAAKAIKDAAIAAAKAAAQLVCRGLVAAMEAGVRVLSAVLNTIRYLLNKVRGWTTTLRTWIDKVVAGKDTVGEKLQEMKNKIRSLDTLDLMESRNVDVLSQRIRGVFELKKLEAHVNLQKTADAARIRASFGVELALNGNHKAYHVGLDLKLSDSMAAAFLQKMAKKVADEVLPESIKKALDALAAPIDGIKNALAAPINHIKDLKAAVSIPSVPSF